MFSLPYYLIALFSSFFAPSQTETITENHHIHTEHHCGNEIFDFARKKDELISIIEDEKPNGDIDIYVKSIAYCPITFDIQFPELINMETDVALPYTAVVPARAEKHKILTISRRKNFRGGSLSFRYGFNYYIGDIDNAKHDDDYVYTLPFAQGHNYLVGQGYNGQYSHRNMYCLDFNMDVGSKVCAARDGVVIRIKEDSNIGCTSPRCQGKANYIVIYHEDGTTGRYIHLQQHGAKVQLGDKVKAGDVIGYSGNTGWSSGPHLHFEVSMNDRHFTKTIPTKFHTSKGILSELKEGNTYYTK